MVPRQIRETFRPDRPRLTYCIASIEPPRGGSRRRSASAESHGFRWLRFRGGAFVANRSQLDRARGLAFLAPMPLGTRQPLPHSTIVANENFFSHAKTVLRRPKGVAKRELSKALLWLWRMIPQKRDCNLARDAPRQSNCVRISDVRTRKD